MNELNFNNKHFREAFVLSCLGGYYFATKAPRHEESTKDYGTITVNCLNTRSIIPKPMLV